jgi:hypothetical protein
MEPDAPIIAELGHKPRSGMLHQYSDQPTLRPRLPIGMVKGRLVDHDGVDPSLGIGRRRRGVAPTAPSWASTAHEPLRSSMRLSRPAPKGRWTRHARAALRGEHECCGVTIRGNQGRLRMSLNAAPGPAGQKEVEALMNQSHEAHLAAPSLHSPKGQVGTQECVHQSRLAVPVPVVGPPPLPGRSALAARCCGPLREAGPGRGCRGRGDSEATGGQGEAEVVVGFGRAWDARAVWVNSRPPALVSPPAAPYSTLTAPASERLPTASPGAPAARSAKPSRLKSVRMLASC